MRGAKTHFYDIESILSRLHNSHATTVLADVVLSMTIPLFPVG